MICKISGRGLSVDIGQFLCWVVMCLSSVWQLMFWILDRAVNMAYPQGSFLPMTLTAHCKYVTLTSFGRPWIAVVVLICQDSLQHCGPYIKFYSNSPGINGLTNGICVTEMVLEKMTSTVVDSHHISRMAAPQWIRIPHWVTWALSYYSDMTLSQEFQPMAAQLSMKAALPLAKFLRQRHVAVVRQGPASYTGRSKQVTLTHWHKHDVMYI